MREIRCRVEFRADQSRESPGRLRGVLLTYGERASDRPEVFERGSLRWPDNGVVLRRQHNRGEPIVRFVPEVRGDQVLVDVPLPDSPAGRGIAAEMRSTPPLFEGLSVEFRATSETNVGGVRRIRGALLDGAGLVDSPSYSGSRVEVRNRGRRRRFFL